MLNHNPKISESMQGRTLFIRADASSHIGTGHIMRCIALAQAWRDSGGNVAFISLCESNGLRQRILDEGFRFIPVKKAHPNSSDLEKIMSVLSNEKENADWFVLDGYHFNIAYQKAVRDTGVKLFVIDDMNHLSHYHADIILNQNIHASTLKYSCGYETILLSGCKYILIRREFLRFRKWKRVFPEKATKILITLGGADPDNVTCKIIRALQRIDDKNIHVKIVVGPANPNIKKIRKELSSSLFVYDILTNVDDMPSLMLWGDLAISAAGSTCWELAMMGMPSLIITTADNQKGVGETLENKGMVRHLGWFQDLKQEEIGEQLEFYIRSAGKRSGLSQQFQSLVDGKSLDRIMKVVYFATFGEYRVETDIRLATSEDMEEVWRIANTPSVRKNSFHSDFIPWNEHVNWFQNKISSPQTIYWVLDVGGIIGAQVRFEKKGDDTAEVHFSVLPSFRGRNISSIMINHVFEESCRNLAVSAVTGIAFVENAASIKVFEKSCFAKKNETVHHNKVCLVFERGLIPQI